MSVLVQKTGISLIQNPSRTGIDIGRLTVSHLDSVLTWTLILFGLGLESVSNSPRLDKGGLDYNPGTKLLIWEFMGCENQQKQSELMRLVQYFSSTLPCEKSYSVAAGAPKNTVK